MVGPIKQNKSQVPHCPSCNKTTKGSLQNVSWTHFHPENLGVLFTILLLESQN